MKKTFFLILLNLFVLWGFAQDLTPVTDYYGKWGYVNQNNDTVIKCQYDKASIFNEGLAVVKNKTKFSLLDKDNNIIDIENFDFTKNIAYELDNWGYSLPIIINFYECKYIDNTGKTVISVPYDDAEIFYDGKAAVYKDAMINYIDKNGKLVDEWKSSYPSSSCAYNGDKYAIANNDGSLISDFIFDNYFSFWDDVACIGKKVPGKSYEYKYAIVNKEGENITDFIYDNSFYFFDNLAVAQSDKNYFLIDKTGKQLSDNYDYLEYLTSDKYLAFKENQNFIIDTEGNIISKKYDKLENKYDGLLSFYEDNKYGVIDTLDNLIFPNEYDQVDGLWDGYLYLGKKNGDKGEIAYAFCNTKGDILTDFIYDYIGYLYSGLIQVGIYNDDYYGDYLYGYIDTTGRQVVECKYNWVGDFYDEYSIVESYTDDYYYSLYGVIDKNGNEIIPMEYENIGGYNEGLFYVSSDYKYGYIDINGKQVIDFQYDYADSFSEGKALVGNYNYDTYEYEYFYIDKKNNRLTQNEIYSSYGFYEGIATSYFQADDEEETENYDDYYYDDYYYNDYYWDYNYKYNIIKYDGNLLVPDTFDYCSTYSYSNLMVVGKDDENGYLKFGYIDYDGNLLVPYSYPIAYKSDLPIFKMTKNSYDFDYALGNEKGEKISEIYSSIYPFVNDFAKVKNSDNQYSFINNSGEQICDFYTAVDNFENGKAKIYQDGKIAYIDSNGDLIGDFQYDIIEKTTNYSIIKNIESYSIVDKDDNLIDGEFDKITVLNDKLAIVQQNESKGVYNSDNNNVIIYSFIEDSNDFPIRAAFLGNYGIIDENYNWVVSPQYDYISEFNNGIAQVEKDGKTNSINQSGELQSDKWTWKDNVEFLKINDLEFATFDCKYALVDVDRNIIGKWYYYLEDVNGVPVTKKGYDYYSISYDTKNNKEELTYFDDFTAELYSYGDYIDDEYKYGYVDYNYNVVIDIQYDYAYDFQEGVAIVEEWGKNYDYKYFIIDENGEKINDEIYDYAYSCSEGLICVEKNYKYGYINKKGEVVIDFIFSYAGPFTNGIANVQDENWNNMYINKKGEEIFNNDDYYINDYKGEFAIAYQYIDDNYTTRYALIDRQGNILTPWYESLSTIGENLFVFKKGEKYILINSDGNILPNSYDFVSIDSYSEEITVINNNKMTFIDKEGNEVSEERRKEIIDYNYYFEDNNAIFSISDDNYYYKYGCIDEDGNITIQPLYNYIYNFNNDRAIVEIYNKDNYKYAYSLIDKKGIIIIDWYDYVTDFGQNLYKVERDGKYSILNENLEQICDWTKTIIETSEDYFIVQNENNFEAIDFQGNNNFDKDKLKEILALNFNFNDGFAVFSVYDSNNYTTKYGIVDTEGVIILSPKYDFIGNFSEGLAPIMTYENDYYEKYGFINTKGEIIIKPQFDYASSFSDGLAVVGKYNEDSWDNLYGYIDTEGNQIVECQYYMCEDFNDGVAIVQKQFDYNIMMSCIDKNGKEFANWYEVIFDFKDGYALALKYNKLILIDKDGNEISDNDKIIQRINEDFNFKNGFATIFKSSNNYYYYEPNTVVINDKGEVLSDWYVSIGEFSDDGLAVVELDLDNDGYTEYGYINQNGNLVIDLQFTWAEKFENGTAVIGVPSSYYYKYGIINTEGDYIIDPVYDAIYNFNDGVAVAGKNVDEEYYSYKYGLIDKSEKTICDFKFDYIGKMSNGLAVVYEYDDYTYTYKYGYINKKGKLKIDYQFDYASDFSDAGIAVVGMDEDNDYYYTYGYINSKGKIIIPCEYEQVEEFIGDFGIVHKEIDGENKVAFVNTSGEIVSEWYDLLYNFVDGYALTMIDNKLQLLDKDLNIVDNQELLEKYLSEKFTFYSKLAVIQKNSLYGYINKKGEIVIDFNFSYAEDFYNGEAYVEKNYESFYLSPDGTLTPAYNDWDYGYEDWW